MPYTVLPALGATPSLTIPSANSNCYEVFSVDASIAWPAPVGTGTLDPRRVVTVTQTGAPAGAVLDSILFSTDENPGVDVKLVFPTTSGPDERELLPRLGRVVLEFHP